MEARRLRAGDLILERYGNTVNLPCLVTSTFVSEIARNRPRYKYTFRLLCKTGLMAFHEVLTPDINGNTVWPDGSTGLGHDGEHFLITHQDSRTV